MLREEIQHGFIRRYGAVGQIIATITGIFLFMAILNFALFLFNASSILQPWFNYLSLPSNLQQLSKQPWSFF
ncbi:MAG: hypothetical protein NZ108_01245, partial [Bacteroidia bacterium]|nr:hypothetical protein [Bacteroidia bacterium]